MSTLNFRCIALPHPRHFTCCPLSTAALVRSPSCHSTEFVCLTRVCILPPISALFVVHRSSTALEITNGIDLISTSYTKMRGVCAIIQSSVRSVASINTKQGFVTFSACPNPAR